MLCNNYSRIVAPFTTALASLTQGKILWTPMPHFDKEFIVETDANLIRLAVLLNQYKGEEMAMIASLI